MSCCCGDDGSKIGPEEINQCKNIEEPIFKKRRTCTDIWALFLVLAIICGFGYFAYAAWKSGDIFRIINGYDDCANTCGKNNKIKNELKFGCTTMDMTDKPYLDYRLINIGDKKKTRECVAKCPGGDDSGPIFNRCQSFLSAKDTESAFSKFFKDATRDLSNVWKELVYLLLIALACSILVLIAFRFLVDWIVYIILFGGIGAGIAGSIYLWIIYQKEVKGVADGSIKKEDSKTQTFMIYASVLSISTFIMAVVILILRKRIALVVRLFREAGKAVANMPILLIQPLYTYAFVILSTCLLVYIGMWIESAGDIKANKDNHYRFEKNAVLWIARFYNCFIFFIMVEFYLGCQHMVVAGAVSRWFFTRDKSRLSLPVVKSFGIVVGNHLGTIALGSLIIAIIELIKLLLRFAQQVTRASDNPALKCLFCWVQCCFSWFESTLRFIGKNAYIETAIYGCSFCSGGRRAFKVLTDNCLRVAAINSVGDFVLFISKLVIVAITVVSSVFMMKAKDGLEYPWLPSLLIGIVSYIIAHTFISIYEMIIDSIFICFCEDCIHNDGINKPYYMSKGLMEFVENSKKVMAVLNAKKGGQEIESTERNNGQNPQQPAPGWR